jgi:hypothetical protein
VPQSPRSTLRGFDIISLSAYLLSGRGPQGCLAATVSGQDKQANNKNTERCFRFGLDLANVDAWKLDGGLSVWID